MSDEKNTHILEEEKERRLSDYEFRLRILHQMRWGLLQMAHDVKHDHTKGYDADFYIEANEILNEVERRVWEYINGIRDEY